MEKTVSFNTPTNLMTKEQFWNPLEVSCPTVMERFKVWIDQYKSAVNWDLYFFHNDDDGMGESYTYKFHDLPDAMQIGIFMEFMFTTVYYEKFHPMPRRTMVDVVEYIRRFITDMEVGLKMLKENGR
jgi:hypothetical protein